jgi:hypothetical protein
MLGSAGSLLTLHLGNKVLGSAGSLFMLSLGNKVLDSVGSMFISENKVCLVHLVSCLF